MLISKIKTRYFLNVLLISNSWDYQVRLIVFFFFDYFNYRYFLGWPFLKIKNQSFLSDFISKFRMV